MMGLNVVFCKHKTPRHGILCANKHNALLEMQSFGVHCSRDFVGNSTHLWLIASDARLLFYLDLHYA